MAVSVIEESEREKRPEFAISLLSSFLTYHPSLSLLLEKNFPVIRYEEDEFGNKMPQGVVGEADHVVLLSLINGDSWIQSLTDLFMAGYFKLNGVGGRNVDKLGSLEIFYDQRMDRRGLKYFFIKNVLNVLVVKGQGSFTKLMARFMKHVVQIDYRVRIDPHSSLDAFQSEEEGIEVVDVTVAFEMLDNLIKGGFLNDDLEHDGLVNVIAGIDLGNLPLVKAIFERYGWDLAVMHKDRIPDENGVDSKVESKLIFGDVEGKRVVLVDDMISSGSTLIETVREAIDEGAAEIIICSTHPVLVGDYYKNLKKLLGNEKVKVVMTTNSIPHKRPMFGSRLITKSIPYAKVDSPESGQKIKKELEVFDVFTFVGMIIQALMNSKGDVKKIKEELADHLVNPADKEALFEELTGMTSPKENIDGIYREGEKVEFFY